MSNYRKKPVVIEAFRFYIDDMPDWFMDKVSTNEITLHNCAYGVYPLEDSYCLIETLEGLMRGEGGDYIIKGIQGEVYPCKSDIFEATYEKVED
jgi:hypothetical protein